MKELPYGLLFGLYVAWMFHRVNQPDSWWWVLVVFVATVVATCLMRTWIARGMGRWSPREETDAVRQLHAGKYSTRGVLEYYTTTESLTTTALLLTIMGPLFYLNDWPLGAVLVGVLAVLYAAFYVVARARLRTMATPARDQDAAP